MVISLVYGEGFADIMEDYRAIMPSGRYGRRSTPSVCVLCITSCSTCFFLHMVIKTFFQFLYVKHNETIFGQIR